MNDKDKLITEILDDLRNEGADESSIPLYERVVRIMTEQERASVPEELIAKLRANMKRKTQVVSIFRMMSKVAVAVFAFAVLLGIAFMEFPINKEPVKPKEKILIAATEKPVVKEFSGVELISEKNTELVQIDDLMNLKQGELIVFNASPKELNLQIQKMNVGLTPNSMAYFENGGGYSQVAVFQGIIKVNVNNQLHNLDANSENRLLYQEANGFPQPVEGSQEKYAQIRNQGIQRANGAGGGAYNSNSWATQNLDTNVRIDRFIWNVNNNKSFLVKRVDISSDGKSCTVVFKDGAKEKKFEIKNGANIGSWFVNKMSDEGFELTDGEKKLSFKYQN